MDNRDAFEKRNIEKSRKTLKKILKICVIVLAATLLLLLIAYGVSSLLEKEPDDIFSAVSGIYFFSADYDMNSFDDGYYLAKDRLIMYTAYGETYELKGDKPIADAPSEYFFHNYFQAIINGDYENYAGFFTEDCLNKLPVPERFTMQMLYDINISLFNRESREVSGKKIAVEVYEVRYRIFENNGTFRGDIPSGETRTLVYELYIDGEDVHINAIGYRVNAD